MCTGFIKKGKDIIFGFNLDIDPEVWNYDLYMNDSYFTVGITVGKTVYFTHGVNKHGHFGNVPYMNDYDYKKVQTKNKERIDLLTDRYIRNKYDFKQIKEILNTKTIVNIPNGSMHSLLANKNGEMLVIEPGYGYKDLDGDYAVITNFPLLTEVTKFEPWFGKDRFDKAEKILIQSTNDFSLLDGLNLLQDVKQEGKWATRVSFVYSVNMNCVYYVINNDFDNIKKHYFK